MKELKTLKDLEFDISNNRTFLMGVTSEELKAEAVKWVKKYTYSIGVFLGADDKQQAEHYQVLVGWLMMFFNLKEEDLK